MSTIGFPGLGIEPFTINKTAFTIFGLRVQWYALIIVVGILLALFYFLRRGTRTEGFSEDDLLNICILVIPISIIGARAVYVLTSLEKYNSIWDALKIWEGGLAIYGAILFGLATVLIYCRHRKLPALKLLDALAPAVMLGQIIGRWGNFINREAFGVETDIFCRMGLTTPDGVTVFVHPTFLYESLWNFTGLIILYILLRRGARKYDGQFTWLYVLWYGLGRAWVEGLRTDSLYIGTTDIRVSQLLAIVSALIAAVILIVNARKKHSPDELFVNRSERTKKADGQERS
mgnify:CR=1 FL=1